MNYHPVLEWVFLKCGFAMGGEKSDGYESSPAPELTRAFGELSGQTSWHYNKQLYVLTITEPCVTESNFFKGV